MNIRSYERGRDVMNAPQVFGREIMPTCRYKIPPTLNE
jgi:hypothetical protein